MLSARSACRSGRLTAAARTHIPSTGSVLQLRIRFQSSPSTNGSASGTRLLPLVVAGATGGAMVILGAYTYYHFSGTKKVVDTAKNIHDRFMKPQSPKASDDTPKNPNEILLFLRSVAKTYASTIPLATPLVDLSFDALDELHDTHREEVNRILQNTYNDVVKILSSTPQKDADGLDRSHAQDLMLVFGNLLSQLNGLARIAGSDVLSQLRERYPNTAQKLGEFLQRPQTAEFRKDVEGRLREFQESAGVRDAVDRFKGFFGQSPRTKDTSADNITEQVPRKPNSRE